jgi:signal transduction histidine kinase
LLQTTKRTGTGLGLAIVHRIVEAHHGELTLRSRPSKGTSIRITFPV